MEIPIHIPLIEGMMSLLLFHISSMKIGVADWYGYTALEEQHLFQQESMRAFQIFIILFLKEAQRLSRPVEEIIFGNQHITDWTWV